MNSTTIPHHTRSRTVDTLLIGSGLIFLLLASTLFLVLLTKPQATAASQAATGQMQLTENPVQKKVSVAGTTPIVWEKGGYIWTFRPRAHFQISARVLGNKRYYDWQSIVLPRDLALGWGEMSDPAVDEWIQWSQSGRWYHYRWGADSPYRGKTIGNYSANVHIIPATENVAHSLAQIGRNDIVTMEGLLVDVEAQRDNVKRQTRTSLTRTDSGAGACEILFVQRLILDGKEYE
jgi:hypothetical protein